MRLFTALLRDDDGQDLIEYSLLIAFLALSCVTFFSAGQGAIEHIWRVNQNNIEAASSVVGG